MKLSKSELDISSILRRVNEGEIVLQPDFQRASVWNTTKQQKLVDSIFRDWHVPPIHLVKVGDNEVLEVLDGQQRLNSIVGFYNDKFKFDGHIDPLHPELQKLNGLLFSELPAKWKRIFINFGIQMYVLSDYDATEPSELFYRLNQSVQLSPPEQRNAFYGDTRDDIQHLAQFAEHVGWCRSSIGFDNKRMAYQDVIAKAALAIENRSAISGISASHLSKWFREGEGISGHTVSIIEFSIECIAHAADNSPIPAIKLNKATAFSWLIAYARLYKYTNYKRHITAFDDAFVSLSSGSYVFESSNRIMSHSMLSSIMAIYDDRSTSRVGNTNSVILRDISILLMMSPNRLPKSMQTRIEHLSHVWKSTQLSDREHNLTQVYIENNWDEVP